MALYLGKNLINGVLTTHYTTTLDTTDANAKDLEIFAGKTAYVNGQKVTGTFAPDPSQIRANEVVANVTGTFTNDGTVTSSEHIRSGYVAYSKGVKITGTYEGLDTSDATATTSDHIRAGYTAYSKGVKITGTYSGVDTSDATATAAQIFTGKTAYVNGQKLTGTALGTATTATAANIMSGKTAYNNSGTLITGTAFATTTNATAATIRSGYKAYSNTGTLITGTGYATTTTAAAGHILSGYTAYTNTGTLLTGTITSQSASGTYYINPGGSKSFPAGYYANAHAVSAYAGGVTVGTFTISAAMDTDSITLSTDDYPDGFCFSNVDNMYDFYGDDDSPEIFAGQINSGFTSGDAIPCLGMRWTYRSSGDYENYYITDYLDTDYCKGTYSSYTLTISSPGYYFARGAYKYAIWY